MRSQLQKTIFDPDVAQRLQSRDDERVARGKDARRRVPRSRHAELELPTTRAPLALLAEQERWFWADQFENTANGDAHYETTGPELWEQCEGRVDVLVCSVGTGGTLSGVSRYLKEKNPALRVVLVDPPGSGLFSWVREQKLEAVGSSVTESKRRF